MVLTFTTQSLNNWRISMDSITPDQLTGGQDQLLAAGSKISYRDIYNMEIQIPLHKKHYYKAEDVDNLFVIMNGVFMDVSAQAHRDQKALSESRKNLQNVEADLYEKSKLLEKVQKQNQKMEEHLGSLITKMTEKSTTEETEAIKELEKKIMALETKNSRLVADQKKAEAEAESLAAQLKEKEESYTRLLESSADKMAELQEEIDKLSQAEGLQSELDSKSKDLEDLQVQLSGKDLQIENLSNQVDILTSDLEDTKETLEALDGEFELLEFKFKRLQELNKKYLRTPLDK